MTQKKFEDVCRLQELIDLSDGIISTYAAYSFEENASTIEDDYRAHADTHISLGDTTDFEKNIYDKIVGDDRPTKGYVYGPYGYGKTSTMVSIWSHLDDNGIIAVPPFTCDSFSSIMQATYGWMHYKLKKESPKYTEDLLQIRQKYMLDELETYAKEKKKQMGITDNIDKILDLFQDMEKQGELDISIPASTLVKFLNECTNLALEAGFEGLAVLPDELQQYFKSARSSQEAEARFRELIFDLHAGATISPRFCILFSMPDTTKSYLDSRAGDVLDRLQRDNLSINLRNVYGQEFPARLWERYSKQFGFEEYRHEIIPEDTLDAIGQICSRQDLSDGPRTVIDLFRISLNGYLKDGTSFDSLRLADAFFNGQVRYDGPKTKIQTAIRDAIQNSNVDTEEKRAAIKLCAVFPKEGLKDEVQENYGVSNAVDSLSKKLHGDVLTWIADGYTLVGVTPEERKEDFFQNLLRRFWEQYDTNDANAEYALNAFCKKCLDENIFEARKGTLTGWTTANNRGFTRETNNTYTAVFSGTFNARYPDRRAYVKVTDSQAGANQLSPDQSLFDTDIKLIFIFCWNKDEEGYIERVDADSYLIKLNTRRRFEDLPKRLQFLRETMNPNEITPFLLLSLAQFIEEADLEFDAAEKQQIESIQRRFIRQAIYTLFNEELLQNAPIDLRRTGQPMIEDIFTKTMEQIYPDYHTFMVSTQYANLLSDYTSFIRSLSTTSQRRGRVVVEDTKENIARLFGLKRVSSFENRIKKQYKDLIELEEWEGDQAKIRAKLHPLEQYILNELEENGEIVPIMDVEELGMKLGYLYDEIDIAVELLEVRGLVEVNGEGDEAYLQLCKTDLDKEEVAEEVEQCLDLIEEIKHLDANRIRREMENSLSEMKSELEGLTDDDGEQLEEILVDTRDLKHRLDLIVSDIHSKYQSKCEDVINEIESEKTGIVPRDVEKEVQGSVMFVGHLNDARASLHSEFTSLQSGLRELEYEIKDKQAKCEPDNLENTQKLMQISEEANSSLEEIKAKRRDLSGQLKGFEEWRAFTAKAGNVKRNITTYCQTFKEEIEEKDLIEGLIAQIAEDFTEEPEATLCNVQNYKERLDEIKEAYEQRQRERRELFNDKREKLDSILKEASNNNAAGLRRAPFDPQDPEQSHRDLLSDFKEAFIKQVLNPLDEKLNESQQDLEYARIVGSNPKGFRDPDEILNDLQEMNREIGKIKSEIEVFQLNGIDEEGELADRTAKLYDRICDEDSGIREETKRFLRPIEPDDEELQETLSRLDHNSLIGFKELLMDYHYNKENVDPEDLLNRIVRLFKLNQVEIKISSRVRR